MAEPDFMSKEVLDVRPPTGRTGLGIIADAATEEPLEPL